jgi:hypothetical protein
LFRAAIARPAFGDKEVAAGWGQDTRFADVAILSSERRDTIEIVPMRSCWEGSIGVRGLLLFR